MKAIGEVMLQNENTDDQCKMSHTILDASHSVLYTDISFFCVKFGSEETT